MSVTTARLHLDILQYFNTYIEYLSHIKAELYICAILEDSTSLTKSPKSHSICLFLSPLHYFHIQLHFLFCCILEVLK